LRTSTKAKLGVKGTMAMARHPRVRRAALGAGVPTARVIARREMRARLQPAATAAKQAGSMLLLYGPSAAEALGLVEPPRRRRRAPALAAVAIAAMVYLLARGRG
jgi:hypothetical protein